ncbi:unnamed protein product [Rotaria sordida]|uniref:Uncharacterized protein n=1 Tax=Rotaria sordida TaxID=392033 RepID=A0A819XGD7_9BILA|nr:unnamed protein product [Rotaria sordida]
MFTHFNGRCFVYCLIRCSLSIVTNNSILSSSLICIYIIKSNLSDFYLTQNSVKLRHIISTTIDIIEKLPSFYYLVRYDNVVSDHLEVKNVIYMFTKIVEHEHVKELQEFYYNIYL